MSAVPDTAGLWALSGVLALGAMSPGASFVLVARLAVARSRAAGLAAALGMGVGCAVFALVALCGLQALLVRVPMLHRGLVLAGALYLLWLAWGLWRRAPTAVDGVEVDPHGGAWTAFWQGVLTQLGNPQTALLFASLFATLLPPQRAAVDYLLLPALAFGIDAGWFALVACVLSAPVPRRWWAQARRPLDRLSALLLAGLGMRLLVRVPG